MTAAARWTRPAFRGDPLPLATAAPVGSVSQSWTGSKYGPVLLDMSANGITCAGVDLPWIRGEYQWTLQQETTIGSGTFNDVAGGANGITNPVTGTTAETIAGVYGPRHSFLLDPATATSYRAKCVARFRNDTDDGYETATFYGTAVTVNPIDSADKLYAASTGSSGNPGTSGSPKDIPTLTNSKQFRVVDAINLTASLDASNISGGQVVSDTDSRVTLTGSGGSGHMVTCASGQTSTDVVFSKLNLVHGGSFSQVVLMLTTNTASGILFVDCGLTTAANGLLGIGSGAYADRVGLWHCDGDAYAFEQGSTFFTHTDDWYTACGLTARSNLKTSFDHCFYVSLEGDDALCRWLSCTACIGTLPGYTLNLDTRVAYGSYVYRTYVADSHFTLTRRGVDASNGNSDSSTQGGFHGVVIEGCVFSALTVNGILYYSANLYLRDCVFFNIPQSMVTLGNTDTPSTSPYLLSVVGCKFYRASGETESILTIEWHTENSAHEVRNCTFQDMRTQPIVLSIKFSELTTMLAAGATFSGNTIYAPNDTSGGKYIYDSGTDTYKTIAEFETATGLSGTFTVANPGWLDPANGDFRTPAEAYVNKTTTVRAGSQLYRFGYQELS